MAAPAAEDELLDYEEEEAAEPAQATEGAPAAAVAADTGVKKGHYVGIHSSGFRDFLLKPELLRAITDCGFEHPSEVQHECIPQAILGLDVICQAKSGMGKTAVFVLASLQQLDVKATVPTILVVCHARELAYQILGEYKRFCKFLQGAKPMVLYGGVPVRTHKEELQREQPNIIVGTPGRILQLVNEKALDLKGLKHFIIDECDKCLEALDMRHDIQEIFKATPREKQVMMFSATLNKTMRDLVRKFMQNPLEICVDDETKLTLHGLMQHYVKLEENQKTRRLVDLLDALEFNQVIIFVKSVARATELCKLLEENNFPAIALTSAQPQEERIRKYKEFKEFQKRILVSTNLLGRGIDIERVNIVFNYDMPESTETYLHRVGRAGRFGTKGLAITFVASKEDVELLNAVQSRFEVAITDLPDQIDTATYMNA